MSKRQLEQLRQTLDSIVEDLCIREKAVDEEHTQLQARLEELGVRQMRVESLEDALCVHQATESDLVGKLEQLVGKLDERLDQQPKWLASELQQFEGRTLGTLTERLTASLQTAISVQLAPLSDDLPDRLSTAIQTALPTATGAALSLPELVRELEKFETRSMASLAARMTAGLQAAMATQLSALTDDLPSKIVAAVTAAIPSAVAGSASGATSGTAAGTTAAAADTARADARTAQLAEELARMKATLAETEALLAEALDQHARSQAGSGDLELSRELAGAQADCVRLSSELAEARAELTQATAAGSDGRDRELNHELVEALRSEVADLRSLLAAKEHDAHLVEELRAEIAALRSAASSDAGEAAAAGDEFLREQLERASCQIVELRTANEELCERVAQLQVNTAPHGPMPHLGQEGLSWEERKRLLLQQLDAEQSQEDSPESQAKRVEVEEILRTTDAELDRRDREIAELRSLLQQQSDAREGMAVGAAAVAQLIESDELVQQEREKLRTIQRSWDEKLRQAEIELSMERAKLARERLHLEEQKQQLEQELQLASAAAAAAREPDAIGAKPGDARNRKWLSRLGLKDEG